jgi:hypothetical protein
MPHEKTTSVIRMKNVSNALIILPGLTRCKHHIVAIKAFLVLGRPFKFPEMTLETFRHRGAIGTAFHVFVPGCPVTIHAIQPLSIVNSVVEFYDLLFNLIPQIEYILMAL